MESKLLEVRDSCTFIPVMATMMKPHEIRDISERHLVRSVGYGSCGSVILTKLESGESQNDPYKWNTGSRTMREAHRYIANTYYELNSGDVIDIEFILGETSECKISQRLTIMGEK